MAWRFTAARASSLGRRAPGLTITANVSNPRAVAVDASSKIYVANSGNSTVTTYTSQGVPTTPTITGVSAPTAVAVGASGKIYVGNATSVTTYNAAGTLSTPTLSGLNNVSGLATDEAGNIYVVESNELKVFYPNGVEIGTSITAGLSGPFGVAVHCCPFPGDRP